MKRLLFLIPLLVVVAGCGATVTSHSSAAPSGAAEPTLTRSMRLDDVPLRLDVIGFHRRGSIAALDLRLVNRAPRGGDSFDIDDTFSREGHYDLGGVLLIDPRTGHELDPLDDDVDLAFTEVDGGATQSLRVAFPAPSGATADLLIPHFGLFRDVPVR
jgi:hypothetical protein